MVVDRSVNDNVFSKNPSGPATPYSADAGWSQDRTLDRLTDSEFAEFKLSCGTTTFTWQQGYAGSADGDLDNTEADWISNTSVAGGGGSPPSSITSSSSLVYNMNAYATNSPSAWDMNALGSNSEDYKSPFESSDPDDVNVDGYPETGPIVYSSVYDWEWPMVYEWSVDLSSIGCGLESVSIQSNKSHHSPSKNDDENDEFEDDPEVLKDWGDLPDGPYNTLESNSGANHIILASGNAFLGESVDSETDGTPSTAADGDDNDASTDDEDGITFLTTFVPGGTADIQVVVGEDGFLSAFIDFDGDGVLELVQLSNGDDLSDYFLSQGTQTLTIKIPSDATELIYARFRITNNSGEGGNSVDGEAESGEVEDYVYENIITEEIDLSVTVGPCWRTLSIPTSGQSYQDFFASFRTDDMDYGGLWTQGATGARYTGGDPNVYTMDGAGGNWTPITDLTTTPAAGTGILISVFDEDDFGNAASSGFPKTAELSGTENSAPVSVSLGTPNGTTNSVDGFSLLGNPFYSAVDFDDLTKSGITGNVWIYDRNAGGTDANGNNGGWISWNGTTGDITDGIIATGQGFVVQNSNPTSSPNVTFEEADKTTGGTFYGKENEQILPDHLRMEIRGEGVYNSAWIQFSDEGDYSEIMRDDVVQFYPFESEYAVLSTMKSGDMLDIGHFPYPEENLQIPLTVETTTAEQLTITLTDLQYSNADLLYLHDTVTGKTIEINEGMEYTFTSSASQAKSVNDCFSVPTSFAKPMKGKTEGPRFYISSSKQDDTDTLPSGFVLEQNYPNPFNPTTEISYELPTQSDVRLEVFDLTGRQVATLVNDSVSAGTHTVNFNAANLSSGVYMYRLQAGSTVLTRKLTLIK